MLETAEVLRATLEGVTEQTSPVAGETVAVRVTFPVNALTEATVIFEVALDPALTITDPELAIVKS